MNRAELRRRRELLRKVYESSRASPSSNWRLGELLSSIWTGQQHSDSWYGRSYSFEDLYQSERSFWLANFDPLSEDITSAGLEDQQIANGMNVLRQICVKTEWPDFVVTMAAPVPGVFVHPAKWRTDELEAVFKRYSAFLDREEKKLPSRWADLGTLLKQALVALRKSLEWMDKFRWVSGTMFLLVLAVALALLPLPKPVVDNLFRLLGK